MPKRTLYVPEWLSDRMDGKQGEGINWSELFQNAVIRRLNGMEHSTLPETLRRSRNLLTEALKQLKKGMPDAND